MMAPVGQPPGSRRARNACKRPRRIARKTCPRLPAQRHRPFDKSDVPPGGSAQRHGVVVGHPGERRPSSGSWFHCLQATSQALQPITNGGVGEKAFAPGPVGRVLACGLVFELPGLRGSERSPFINGPPSPGPACVRPVRMTARRRQIALILARGGSDAARGDEARGCAVLFNRHRNCFCLHESRHSDRRRRRTGHWPNRPAPSLCCPSDTVSRSDESRGR